MKHVTTPELERRIRANYEERTATHRAMMGDDHMPVITPLGDKWVELSARYVRLADESGRLYAELCRREAIGA